MRKKTVRIAVTAAAGLMLTGCGDVAYNLTGSEERIIVDYAAHMVTKYNTWQKEGLSYVDLEPEPETETEEPTGQPVETEPETELQDLGVPLSPGMPEGGEDTGAMTAGLPELFGMEGISIACVGARLDTSYMEAAYYAVQADPGYTYLILGIDVTNTSEQEIALDYLSRQPHFSATVNGEVRSPAEVTALTDDFATYAGTLSAGETKEMVLLFQVPESVQSVDSLQLEVSVDGNNYQIIL